MPRPRLTRLSSICIWVRSSETLAAYESSCPLGLAARVVGAGRSLLVGLVLRLVLRDRVARDAEHLALEETIAGEGEGIDLDLGVLARTHEADVAIRYHGLDLELALLRHQHQQSLRRGDHAA